MSESTISNQGPALFTAYSEMDGFQAKLLSASESVIRDMAKRCPQAVLYDCWCSATPHIPQRKDGTRRVVLTLDFKPIIPKDAGKGSKS